MPKYCLICVRLLLELRIIYDLYLRITLITAMVLRHTGHETTDGSLN